MKQLYLSLLFIGAFWASGGAQSPLEERVSLSIAGENLETALYMLVDEYGVKLSFSSEILPPKKVSIQMIDRPLREVLDELLSGVPVRYRALGRQIILYREDLPVAEKKYTISGFLEDAATGERLIAANVYDRVSKRGAVTNDYGFYSLTLTGGRVELTFSYLGYEPQNRAFFLNTDQKLNLSLNISLTLAEVTVIAKGKEAKVAGQDINSGYINIADIDRLPTLGGESDLIRLTHLLPGVHTGTDGVGGVYIRGGNPDQNLILIDGAPVYNISHAAGIFSVFNTNAIRSARLIKGGFPARYGGRLSSILDIRTKEGNMREFKGRADIGVLTSRLSLEGPIIKEKSSFFLSGRLSLLDWYLRPLTRNIKAGKGEDGFTGYRFYDFNAKFNYTFSERDRIYLSFYKGGDRFTNQGDRSDSLSLQNSSGNTVLYRYDQSYRENLHWGNNVAAFRWNHLFSDKLFANVTAVYSKLAVDIDYFTVDSLMNLQTGQRVQPPLFSFGKYKSGIEDTGLKVDFEFIPSTNHYFRFGVNIIGHSFNPGALTIDQSNDFIDLQSALSNQATRTQESTVYVEDEIQFGRRLRFNLGVHAANWSVQARNYRSLQPRVSAYWKAGEKIGLHASFSRMTQFLHLLSSTSIGILPTDLWVPSTAKVKPQNADQVSAGLDAGLWNAFNLSLEGYYKKMNNLINFSEGAFFLNDWENNVTPGEGRAYGLEVFLQKRAGNTTGWISYGLSWADRRFDRVNQGRRFPFKFDRRHDLKIVVAHRFAPWVEFSADWIFSSGFAYSLALEKYIIVQPGGNPPEIVVEVPGEKNQYRMPYYHRLDANFNFYFQTRTVGHTLSLGVYNMYDRRNPLYYDLRRRYVNENNELTPKTEFVQVWLIPFLPSLSYSVKF
jgi:hypothetical protein